MQTLHNITSHNDGVFNAHSGKLIDIINPSFDMFTIEDISAALSKICRFGGHCKEFYSVAQHSVLVSKMCSPEAKLEGLLHDATEAYLGDVIKPLKVILGSAYRDIEERFERKIFERFGLDYSQMEEVKYWDQEALKIEFKYLVEGDKWSWRIHMKSLRLDHHLEAPQESQKTFHTTFRQLYKIRPN